MTKKVFISHSSKDEAYAKLFVELLKVFGFPEENIFCSAHYATGIAYGELIFQRLKQELVNSPVMIYLLSSDYYESVCCLNEMGASWMMSDDHYPVALPKFEVDEIKGAISSSRLALTINQLDEKTLFRFIEKISLVANVKWPENIRLKPIEYIKPLKDRFNDVTRERDSLIPENNLFETTLGDERPLFGAYKNRAKYYKLTKKILPKHLKIDDKECEGSQYLIVLKSQGEFNSGDRVRFQVRNSKQKYFSDIGPCRNIYVKFIEKV